MYGWEMLSDGWGVKSEKWEEAACDKKLQEKGKGCRHNYYHYYGCILITIILNTCGTHLGDTKLVASIDERPVSDSISINLILDLVGTTAYKQKRTMQLWTITTVTCLSLHTWKDWNIWSAKSTSAEPGRLDLAIVIPEYFLDIFHDCVRGGGEHSATPRTFFVFWSSTKKWRHIR